MRDVMPLFSIGKKRPVVGYIALAVCACFISVSFLSIAFILACAGHTHDCCGPKGCCKTCLYVLAAESLLEQLNTAAAVAAIAAVYLHFSRAVLKPLSLPPCFHTLIELKIRLNC